MSAKSSYLLFYNASLTLAWSYVLALTVLKLSQGGSLWDLWQTVEVPLKISQTAAIAEVIHAAIGLVRSPPFITAMQVASRLWIVWGIVNLAPDAATASQVAAIPLPGLGKVGLSFASLVIIWSLSEILRYGHFATKEAGIKSKALLWLRYTGFIILYPLGVSSEIAMVYLVSPVIKEKKLLSLSMPNALNFAFDYWVVAWVIVLVYLPAFPQLYGYMLAQRRKILGGGEKKNKKA